jgi:hypothetical protein
VSLVFGYAAGASPGSRGGMRAYDDGRVELLEPGADWREIATLSADEVDQLAERTRAAGILDLPEEVPRPAQMDGGGECELRSELDGRSVRSVIHGWNEMNPPARPSLELVLAMSGLVSAAQTRG